MTDERPVGVALSGGGHRATVFALGAGHEVVATDTSSVFPEGTHRLPRVGYQRTLSAEGILVLSPDLVIAADEAGPPATLEQLRSAGVRVERMPPAQTVDEAVAIATADAGGFLGTWVEALLMGEHWIISAHSKSAQPPTLYAIHRATGHIRYKTREAGDLMTGHALDAKAGAMVVTDFGLEVALPAPPSPRPASSSPSALSRGT